MTCDAFAFCPSCGKPITHDQRPIDLRTEGLQERTVEVLAALKRYGPLGAVALRRRLGIRNIGYHMDRLRERGLVEKFRPDPQADRVYRVVGD